MRAKTLTIRIIHFFIAVLTVAGCLAFPHIAFWAFHVASMILLVGISVALLWLIADGVEPFPWMVRHSAMMAPYIFALSLGCWGTSIFFALRYDSQRLGTIILTEHAIGRLRSNHDTKGSGWSISLSKSSAVRLQPSGGSSGTGEMWESHYYFPFSIPLSLSCLLLLTFYSATFQSMVRYIGKKA